MRALAGVLLWGLLACASGGEPLRIGHSGDYAPFSADGAGLDVDVARRLATWLGREPAWVTFRWPELLDDLRAGRFQVAMSGVTWRADRALHGYMSRAIAAGGPCVIGPPGARRVGVNRGGALERWARSTLTSAQIVALDDNRSLPARLAAGEVEAIVTDSFELPHFRRPGQPVRCEPPTWRKVYWVAPGYAALGPRIDAFVRAHEGWIAGRRARWLGSRAPRDDVDHVIDLSARRVALMPGIAAWKRARGVPVHDAAREARVFDAAAAGALRHGLDPGAVRALFALQMELARRVQRDTPADAVPLELEPARALLIRLGERLLEALAQAGPFEAPADARLAPLTPFLRVEERARLARALAAASR